MKDHPFLNELDKISKQLVNIHDLLMNEPEIFAKKKILNNKECMELLNVSQGTLANWRKLGKIPYKQIDNKIFYLTSDIIDMLNSKN